MIAMGANTPDFCPVTPPKFFAFTEQQVATFLQEHSNKREFASYTDSVKTWKRGPLKRVPFYSRQEDLQSIFTRWSYAADVEKMRSLKAPAFLWAAWLRRNWNDKTNMRLNPRLSDFGFARVLDPFTAYQELRMWLSNLTNPEKPIPYVSDQDMLLAKGFDKFSFRKDPGGKKRKNKSQQSGGL